MQQTGFVDFGNFDVKNTLHSYQPIMENIDKIFQKIEENCHVSSYDN